MYKNQTNLITYFNNQPKIQKLFFITNSLANKPLQFGASVVTEYVGLIVRGRKAYIFRTCCVENAIFIWYLITELSIS